MMLLADLTLRVSLILLAGLGARRLLRARSAALRHAVLAASMFAAAGVAPLSLVLPSWHLPPNGGAEVPPPTATFQSTPTVVPAAPADTPTVTLAQLAAVLWGGGVLVGAGVLLTGLARLRWIARRARRAQGDHWTRLADEISAASGVRRPVVICHTDAPDLLATFGLSRPRVLLPSHAREWREDRVRVVLTHEFAHIRRHDWVVQISADLLRIVFWFNPLVWAVCARLRRDSEVACDDAVLGAGVGPREYAAHLLELARLCRRPTSAWAAATPIARPSTLERRFVAMLNPALDRRPLSRRAAALTSVLLLALTLPIAAFNARQTTPRPLSGSVYDATGAVLPSVELTVEDAGQNTWRAVSDASGRFEFAQIAPGEYVLKAGLAGFRPLRHELALRSARDWDRAVTLQVGTVSESINVMDQRPATAPAAARPAGPQPVRVGGNIRMPRKVLDVRPVYPPAMRDAGREGVVPIDAVIGQDGAVHSVRVLSASIHPDFAVAAVDAVRQWRFDPTLLNGAPVDVAMTVKVAFSLSD